MRVLSLLVASLCVAAVMAGAGEHDSEVVAEVAVAGEHERSASELEMEVPVLPGMNAGCLAVYEKRDYRSTAWKRQGRRIVSFGGKCVSETACPAGQAEAGYCAGVGVVCCRGLSAPAPTYPTPRRHHNHRDSILKPEQRIIVDAEEVVRTPRRHPHSDHHRNNRGPNPNVFTPQMIAPQSPAVAAPAASTAPPATVILKSGLSICQSKGGVCKDVSACDGTTQSNMCSGPATTKCCFARSVTPPPLKPPTTPPTTPTTPPTTPVSPASPLPPGTPLNTLMRIPVSSINGGVSLAGASFLISKIGKPGCALTPACFNCNCAVTNALIKRLTITATITPNIRITGLKPYVEAVQRAFAALKAAGATNPELMNVYNSAKTAGGLCCRPIKHSDGSAGATWSNHSWGCAADFYFGPTIDPRGDGKCQYGLYLLSPFMNAEKLYWAAGYKGSEEDAMHFETSQESMNSWIAQGLLK